jgi:REP element-mobilizing transposase RayT
LHHSHVCCNAESWLDPLYIEYPGALYNVTSRGDRQEVIFDDDQDRTAFLNILGEVVSRYRWHCHAYCLMGNHYHLMIETPGANLIKGMRQLNGVFTQWSNRRHKRSGHLFQGFDITTIFGRGRKRTSSKRGAWKKDDAFIPITARGESGLGCLRPRW